MTATTFLLLAAAVAVALLLLLHLRLSRRQENLHLRFAGFEQDQKAKARELDAQVEDTRSRLDGIEEGVKPTIEALERSVTELEEQVQAALSKLATIGNADEAAAEWTKARERLDAWTESSATQLADLGEKLADAGARAGRLETQVAHVRDVLGERIGALEIRVRAPAGSPRGAVAAASTRGASTAPSTEDAPGEAAPDRAPRRVDAEGFTYEGEIDEPAVPALRGILVLVALLTGLTMLFHVLGVGR